MIMSRSCVGQSLCVLVLPFGGSRAVFCGRHCYVNIYAVSACGSICVDWVPSLLWGSFSIHFHLLCTDRFCVKEAMYNYTVHLQQNCLNNSVTSGISC